MDPDQVASSESTGLDLQCFQKRINPGSAGVGLKHPTRYYHSVISAGPAPPCSIRKCSLSFSLMIS